MLTAFFLYNLDIFNMSHYFTYLLFYKYLPKIRRDDVELALLALFSAVHLYAPSMFLVTFGRNSWYSSSV